MSLIKAEAENRLRRAARKAHRNRLARLVTHPWKLFYPRVLRAIGLSHTVSAVTFWRGRFEALLPEAVSTHIWRYGFFEEDVCLFLLRTLDPGMVFIDVGAHYGFFSLLGSELVCTQGRVVALEPMPRTFAQLTNNVARNGRHHNVLALNFAAYSANEMVAFRDYGLIDAGLNSAFGVRGETRRSRQTLVHARRCDDLVEELRLPRVDVIKIDAESSEMHVLRGAEATIRQFSPRIILEVGDFDLAGVARSTDLVRWLSQHGYVAHEWSDGGIAPHQPRDTYAYGNLLFVRPEN